MAEPLKNSFGPDIPLTIGLAIQTVHPSFDGDAFVAQCLDGYDDLELTPRARQVSDALADHLPSERDRALQILIESLAAEPAGDELTGMDGFRYLPQVFFVAEHGLEHFDLAMEAQYELTRRFTAEFSIRAYLEHDQQATLERLRIWALDPDTDVRRLVSEGTRPRLPWAPRLKSFQDDPTPVLELLEMLKDDPAEYVRRSVANNLNDIAKDHPEAVVDVARRWWADGDRNRRRLVRHGLRTLIKQGHPEALEVLGYRADAPVEVLTTSVEPATAAIGGTAQVGVELVNRSEEQARAIVDFVVHFVKANGSTSAKVFKGAEVALDPGDSRSVKKTISLAQLSTRKHYPGTHQVEVLVNGVAQAIGSFELTD